MVDDEPGSVMPLADTDYGAREFAVRDLEGSLWRFDDYLGNRRRPSPTGTMAG